MVASLMLFGVGWLLDRVSATKASARKSLGQIPTVQLARAEGAE